ncbi:YfcE family phosphodiesterase [Eremococcus coleocola]|uniref:Phosphoesterase n=1 Tax=Eremococcus coleocola ACS-139-V-Col8 TaxID=908337 RepID=E4KM59_9LACT|nr:YfcE family phosphodiesterase [Eremococcus coleocola]EFR32036.1 phosphodiesterase family protein [Eremococcus coleocola ACS-139-V-Col8]
MKMLVLSDNHGRYDLVMNLLSQWRDKVDYIFHTGDSEFSSGDVIWGLVDGVVKGNMDFDPGYEIETFINTPAGKVALSHGHYYGVNHGLGGVKDLAQTNGAKFMFHGHTHKLYARMEEGILFVNPGSLNHSRGPEPERTFAVVEVNENQIKVDFYDDDQQKLDRLSQQFDL